MKVNMKLEKEALKLLNISDYTQVMEAFPNGLIISNSLGKIVYCNNELLEMFGYTKSELLGHSVEILVPEQYSENHPNYLASFMKKPTKRSMGVGREVAGLRKNGDIFPVEIGLNPIESENVDIVIATITDISQRRQLEGNFKNIIEAAPIGILIMDGHGNITHINSQLLTIFGYEEQELINEPVENLLPERHRKEHVSSRNGFIRSPSARAMGLGRDLTGLHKRGIEIPIEIGLNPVSFHGKTSVIATISDISQRKIDGTRLQQLNADLDEFTYVASHDLKSPLRGINDLLEWIEEDLGTNLPKDVKKNLDRAHIRISRMEKLISNLLSYAKSGHQNTEMADINIIEVITNIITDLSAPPDFSFHTASKIAILNVAHIPLETVLRNLISNAIKHHNRPDGHIEINVKTKGRFYIFSIQDDGPGIPEHSQQRVFKLFQTLSTTQGEDRTGVGLAVVKRLVEAQGGKVQIVSNMNNQGTEFIFSWPRYLRSDLNER